VSKPITRENYTFDERMKLLLKHWNPKRGDESIKATLDDIYMLAGYQPSWGEPEQVMGETLMKYLMIYKLAGDQIEARKYE
jgi:hypothetical protein